MGSLSDISPRLVEELIGYLGEAVAVFDRDETLILFNNEFENAFWPADIPLNLGTSASALVTATTQSKRVALSNGGGDYEWFDPELSDFRAAAGRPVLRRSWNGSYHSITYTRTNDGGTAVVATSVTEQRRFIRTLAEQEEYLRQVLLMAAEGIISLDARGIIHSCNAAARRIFGYAASDIIGRNLAMLISAENLADDAASVRHWLEEATARKPGDNREVVGVRSDGETFPMTLAIAQIQSSKNVKFIVVVNDLSKTRDIEEQLRHADKLTAVGELTEGIAHDFNNLLSVILANLRQLERQDDMPGEASSQVAAALRATLQAGELSRHLLVFSRQSPLQPVIVDPAAVVSDVIDMLTPILGRQIKVRVRAGCRLGNVRVDPAQLQNALVNLAINARDAMSGAGTLTISVREASVEERQRSAADFADTQNVVVLEIEDDGHGMTPDVLERAATPFFTTKDVGEGSGLGLSMVHRFLEESGGDLQIDSEAGVGTTVRLLLPAVNVPRPQPC